MAAKRILVVEDEGIIGRDIERALTKVAYDVIGIASTGEEALARTDEHRPDLILMDIKLKGELDGIETAQRIRQQYEVPIVYLTAYPATLQRATATAPFGYLLKPFEERELYSAVETALYRQQMQKDLRSARQQLASMLSIAFDGIIVTDRNGLVAAINQAASTITEWSCDAAVGKDWAEVFRTTEPLPSDMALFSEGIGVVAEGDGASFAVLLSLSGRRIPVEHRSTPITDDRREVEGTVFAFHALPTKGRPSA